MTADDAVNCTPANNTMAKRLHLVRVVSVARQSAHSPQGTHHHPSRTHSYKQLNPLCPKALSISFRQKPIATQNNHKRRSEQLRHPSNP